MCDRNSNTSLQCIHPRIGLQNYTLNGHILTWNLLPQTKGNYTEHGSISWTTGFCWTRKGTPNIPFNLHILDISWFNFFC